MAGGMITTEAERVVKRYDHIVPECYETQDIMFENKVGDYVLYADHQQALLTERRRVLEMAERAVRDIPPAQFRVSQLIAELEQATPTREETHGK